MRGKGLLKCFDYLVSNWSLFKHVIKMIKKIKWKSILYNNF